MFKKKQKQKKIFPLLISLIITEGITSRESSVLDRFSCNIFPMLPNLANGLTTGVSHKPHQSLISGKCNVA